MINTLFACGKSKHKKMENSWGSDKGPYFFFYGNSHGKQEWHQQKYVFKHIRALACARFISAGYCLFDKVSFYWEKKERKKKRDLRIYLMHVSFCLFTCETYLLFVCFVFIIQFIEQFKASSPLCVSVGKLLFDRQNSAMVRHTGLQLLEHAVK